MAWLYGPIGAGALSVKLLFHLSHLWFKYICYIIKTVFVYLMVLRLLLSNLMSLNMPDLIPIKNPQLALVPKVQLKSILQLKDHVQSAIV
jgi:hypothetical protein